MNEYTKMETNIKEKGAQADCIHNRTLNENVFPIARKKLTQPPWNTSHGQGEHTPPAISLPSWNPYPGPYLLIVVVATDELNLPDVIGAELGHDLLLLERVPGALA